MWTIGITGKEFDLLLEGKTLEKIVETGLIVIEEDPAGRDTGGQGVLLRIKFLTREEAGLRF